MSPTVPERFGRYEIVRAMPSGGMADIYLARDPRIGGRSVVIKVLRDSVDTPEIRERFAMEANLLGGMNHVNLVTVFDVGVEDGRPFIAMEFIQGETLSELIARRPALPLNRKLQLMEELCLGLDWAHRAGVVHRDIKPANLMVDQAGVLKILDFGIARVGSSLVTRAGTVLGTLNYMAPEQIMGESVDLRADMFAAGAVFYELLCYRRAFPGQMPAIMRRILEVDREPLADVMPDLAPDLVRVVDRCLSRGPGDRFRDMSAVRKALSIVRQRVEQDQHQRLHVYVTDAHAALDLGDLPGAQRQCESGLAIDPDWEPLLDVQDQIRSTRARRVEQRVLEARAELEQGALTTALSIADDALSLDPASPAALAVRAAVEAARQQRAEGRARADRIAGLLERAARLLSSGGLDEALSSVTEALTLDAAHAEALSLKAQIDRAVAEQHRKQEQERAHAAAEAAARAAVESARRLFISGRIDEALQALDAYQPPHPRVTAVRAELLAEAETIQREKRARADREASEKARKQAEEKARKLAAEQARQAAAEKTQREAAAKAQREAAEKVQREAAEKAQRAAAEKAQREAAEKAQREAADRAQREAADKARMGAEERARTEAAETVRREAAAKTARAAAQQAERDAAQAARQAAQEARQNEAAEVAIVHARKAFQSGQIVEAFRSLEAHRPSHPKVTTALTELREEARAQELARRELEARRRREGAGTRKEADQPRLEDGDTDPVDDGKSTKPFPAVVHGRVPRDAEADSGGERTVFLPGAKRTVTPPEPPAPIPSPWNRRTLAVVAVVAVVVVVLVILFQSYASTDPSPADADADGVVDTLDQCPDTPAGTVVAASGCADQGPAGRDADGDGVDDSVDTCPGTAAGATVNASGCVDVPPAPASDAAADRVPDENVPPPVVDSDADGIADASDRCANTPAGSPVNRAGCPDSDRDGVADTSDLCVSPPRSSVDATGCPPPPANPAHLATWTPPQDGRPMIWLRPGRYQMGSDPGDSPRGEYELDRRQMEVTSGFWLDQFEVSNDKYAQFVQARPEWRKGAPPNDRAREDYLRHWAEASMPPVSIGSQPVTYVSYYAAQAYCQWAGKRLPSEIEWEYAARAQNLTAYWWGADMNDALANNGVGLIGVGEGRTRNPWGFHHILGNAMEWTQEGWLRGGAINRRDVALRLAGRLPPQTRQFANVDYGIRCAR